LDEEKSKHVGLAQQQNGCFPTFFFPRVFLRLVNGTGKLNIWQRILPYMIGLLLPVSDWLIIMVRI
jgi:hypothetical protein